MQHQSPRRSPGESKRSLGREGTSEYLTTFMAANPRPRRSSLAALCAPRPWGRSRRMEEGMEQRLPTWLVNLVLDTLACFAEPVDRGTVYLGHGLEPRHVEGLDPGAAATMGDACWVSVPSLGMAADDGQIVPHGTGASPVACAHPVGSSSTSSLAGASRDADRGAALLPSHRAFLVPGGGRES